MERKLVLMLMIALMTVAVGVAGRVDGGGGCCHCWFMSWSKSLRP